MYSAIVVSAFLAVSCIVMSMAVILLWLPGNLGESKSKHSVSVRWLVTGIVASFVASIIDNAWWGIAWSLRYADNPSWHWWFDFGVYSNIASRQGIKIFAAWCHIKAAVESGIISGHAAYACGLLAIIAGALAAISLLML